MGVEEKYLLLLLLLLTISYQVIVYIKASRPVRQCKTRVINQQRKKNGFFVSYFLKMKINDPGQFFKYTRMTLDQFDYLLLLVSPIISKRQIEDGITAEERLAVTLHYLSQGCSFQNIAWTYQMGVTTVHFIVQETCEAIWTSLSPIVFETPSEENWKAISSNFYRQWNMPNCIGAMDGKHIHIQCPKHSGSLYFNYKKTFSVVLLASCDANYIFNMIDVGAYGSQSDGGIFKNSLFGQMLDSNELKVPGFVNLPKTQTKFPHYIVADEAFPLKTYIMRPYPGKMLEPEKTIFNYRLSRARRVIENAFGILTNRWRILRTHIISDVDNIDKYVKAVVCLHNYLQKESRGYCPPGFVDTEVNLGAWRNEVTPLPSVGRISSNRAAKSSYELRDVLKEYFMSPEGEVPWQYAKINEGYAQD